MNKRERLDREYQEEWMRAYKKISKLTGLELEETVGKSYCLVVDREHELFGEVGVYRYSHYPIDYFKFKGKRELVGFNHKDSSCLEEDRKDRKISCMINLLVLLEERAGLGLD